MKPTITIEIKAFQTPDFVLAENPPERLARGLTEPERYPLSALDAEVLEQLCSDFTSAVFKQAGKQRLPTCRGPK